MKPERSASYDVLPTVTPWQPSDEKNIRAISAGHRRVRIGGPVWARRRVVRIPRVRRPVWRESIATTAARWTNVTGRAWREVVGDRDRICGAVARVHFCRS